MIVVDSSVWIDFFNGNPTPRALFLRDRFGIDPILVGDLVLTEVLQGFRDDREFEAARSALNRFPIAPVVGPDIALYSARNYRTLRAKGVTVRKTIDLIIATFCLTHGHALLHEDRDFDPMETHLGLKVIHPEMQ